MTEPRTIIIDEGVLTAKAINSWGSVKLKILNGLLPPSTFLPPVSYIWFSMVLGVLKRIGITKEDLILIARDKTTSFRKFFYPAYKSQRWAQREEKSHIDWMYHYKVIDEFLDQLQESTNWHVLWHPKFWNGADLLFTEQGQKFINEDELDLELLDKSFSVEADDWIASAGAFYTDREVIFASIDCLSGNTTVKLADGGSKRIKDILVGEKVMSVDINNKNISSSTVHKKFKNTHHTELYHIYYDNRKTPIKCTGKHKFYTTKGWKKASDLSTNDILYHIKKNPFPYNNIQNNYKLGYILGLVDGDGHKMPEYQSVHVEMCDIEPLKRMQQYLKDLFGYECVIRETKITKGNKQAYKINCCLNYRYNYLMKQYNKKSKHFYRGYCAGFYDAEGSLSESSQQLAIHIDQKFEKQHLYRVQNYMNALDIKISNIFMGDKRSNVERFVITGESVLKFLNICKPAIKRKYPTWEFSTMYLQNGYKINKIEKKFNQKDKFVTYDLNVVPHHNYVIEGNVVVHNCDLDQLTVRDNTKFFTLTQKYNGGTGVYKQVKNGYEVLAKKIEKGDKSDNILPGITDNNSEKDKEIRKLIIDLINLPEWVTEKTFPILANLPQKEMHYELLPFQNSLAKKFDDIYLTDKIVTYEESVKYFERKKKKVAKQAKLKREEKKLEKLNSTMIENKGE